MSATAEAVALVVTSLLRCCGRELRARREPLLVGLERQSELVVEDAQVAVAIADDGVGPDARDLLGHDADIGFVASLVGEAIEAKAVVEMAEQRDVVLERDIGPASTAAHATAATAAHAGHARATTHAGETGVAAAHHTATGHAGHATTAGHAAHAALAHSAHAALAHAT